MRPYVIVGAGAIGGPLGHHLARAGPPVTVRLERVLLAVKAQATGPALEWIAPRLADDGFVVSLQNGLNEDEIAHRIGRDRTVGAFVNLFADVIGPDGAFATFAYRHGLVLSAARRFRRALHETFEEVLVTATVWRNVPPAFVYVCRRPRPPAES